ncbi:hypothetical protein [Clostridium tagluense]|uniref:Lipoprotein n=1 Tax=Clostridium tagluense TaxID=360422 RepID=A0A401UQ85_9CLOT|nr:hypothetical protein [Clostridium tagluense]GCD11723.1 hypothetical protein Ctaglu_33460 [Clostridium tagluense]
MKKAILVLFIVGTMVLGGCNNGVKENGGTMELNLSKGEKLVNVTWSDSNLWYLTKPMIENDKAERYEFKEKSNLGVSQGKVIIQEAK